MPTVLYVKGWRLYFYSNEGREPMHVHAMKAESERKYWLNPELFDVRPEFEWNCSRDYGGKSAR